jgi:hypothetical protein
MAFTISFPVRTTQSTSPRRPCPHHPTCPSADAPDHDVARCVARHPEQGWSLLCNGVVCFEDTGELLPDGRAVAPHRPTDPTDGR